MTAMPSAQHPYSRADAACLRHVRVVRFAALAAALVAALPLAGCSYSYKLDGLFAKDAKGERSADRTASLKPKLAPDPAASEPDIGAADLAIAKQTATELLAKGGKDVSLPWENPNTGARGTVTAIAAAYTQDGFTCHDFLASHVRGAKESWYQGGACRIHGGRWHVRDIKPLQRT